MIRQKEERYLGTSRIFRLRNCQMVRLPIGMRFRGKELEIFREGPDIVLREKRGKKRISQKVCKLRPRA
jgi:virulence-associated protein VagC